MKTLQEGIDWQLGITFLWGLANALIFAMALGITGTPFWLEAVILGLYLVSTYAMVKAYDVLCEQVEAYDGLVSGVCDRDSIVSSGVRVDEG